MTSPGNQRIESFDFKPGRLLGGKYIVEGKLGGGWEGEVYKVREKKTGLRRAAKLFFPHRNEKDKAVTFYARKLDRLRDCHIVIQYFHSETVRHKRTPITCLISEFVDGELLSNYVNRQRGKRLPLFEAMHLTYTLARGLEDIHKAREYHGDLHEENVLVQRKGILFDVKLVDFYHWGAPTKAHLKDDVADLIRLFYDMLGGKKHYANQPPEIKAICKGLRRDLIGKQFPTAQHLREYLESFAWDN